MINILSYVGMDMQSEVCLWTLLGLLRTIFDATLFKVNANLKQLVLATLCEKILFLYIYKLVSATLIPLVLLMSMGVDKNLQHYHKNTIDKQGVWQMRMPEELTRPVQRVLRTMISGVILVQCFTLYVYLASYIVLLYPVFLEERPTLVLPWLLLAAIRKLLCELMSLALGLGTCVLLGPARPPCIKFVIVKLASITPAFYMWFLVFSYYHALKMSTAFKTFTAVLTPNDRDYGLELAVRRRMTKSLQGEDQLRRKLIASLYGERNTSMHMFNSITSSKIKSTSQTPDNSIEDMSVEMWRPQSVTSNRTMSDIGTYEDWFGSEVALPRDTDRILEQFGLMLLRIAAFLEKDDVDPVKFFNTSSQTMLNSPEMYKCTAVANDDTDTPPHVGSSKGRVASYLTDYPQIFMKKTSDLCRPRSSEHELIQVRNICTTTEVEGDEHNNVVNNRESENYISYEVTRRMNTIELDLRDSKLVPGALTLRESNNNMSKMITASNCNKNISEKSLKCKAINTACRLKNLNKSLCTGKMVQPAECSKNVREKTKKSVTENKNLQKTKTKKDKPSSSSSENSSNSNY